MIINFTVFFKLCFELTEAFKMYRVINFFLFSHPKHSIITLKYLRSKQHRSEKEYISQIPKQNSLIYVEP